jgi:hypothetical protein
MPHRTYTTGQLIVRSLTPSPTSGFLCFGIGLLLAVIHIVLLSVSVGTALPGVLDGQWAVTYTDNVVEPLNTFFTNGAFNKLLVAVLWGGVGLVVYLGFEYAVHSYQNMKNARRQVVLNANGAWEQRAMQNDFLKSALWRVGVLVAGLIFLICMQPLFRIAFSTAPQVVTSQSLTSSAPRILGSALVWMLFLHGCLVLLRLYTQRTRIFGDESLY